MTGQGPAAAARAALLLAVCGCGHRAPSPGATLTSYGAALERGDHRAAYAQMSAGYRQRVPYEQFRRQLEAGGGDARWTGSSLRQNGERWGARLEVPLAADERALLVREAGGWRLEAPPFPAFNQETPRAALRAFIRAVETRRYDVLVELAPARYRAEVTPEKLQRYWQARGPERTRALLAALLLALERPVIEEGDEAYIVYQGDRQVRFVREEGLWRVESPE
jgi:hypothetical protein